MREDSNQTSNVPWEECERSSYGNIISVQSSSKEMDYFREDSKSAKPVSLNKELESVKLHLSKSYTQLMKFLFGQT